MNTLGSNNMLNMYDIGINKKMNNVEKSSMLQQYNTDFDDSEKSFITALAKLYNELNNEALDITNIDNLLTFIENLRKNQQHDYIKALLYPEKGRGCKLPSQMPIPSSSFQLKQSFNITTNATGNACVIINPFYLGVQSAPLSTVYINNAATLTGTASDNNFTAVSVGQNIPNVYNQYRLVSAAMTVKYVGRLDIVQGIIGGAIVYDQSIIPDTAGNINANLAKYGDFNLAQDAFFQQENYSLQGIRELYFPFDNSFEEYIPVGIGKAGYGMLVYISGAPQSTASFKVDLYFNMECLPDNTFLNYIPTTLSQSYDSSVMRTAVDLVRKSPISSDISERLALPMNETKNISNSLLEKVGGYAKETGKKVLPSIAKLVGGIFGLGGVAESMANYVVK